MRLYPDGMRSKTLPQGFLHVVEAEWLAKTAASSSIAIEFGAWCGRSTVCLAAAKTLISVDTFLGTPNEPGGAHAAKINAGLSPAREWRESTKGMPNVVAVMGDLRSPSVERLLLGYAGAADLVFIDANHSYESVMADIALAKKLVSPTGTICGHDYHPAWGGVLKAVDETFPKRQIVAGTIWAVQP